MSVNKVVLVGRLGRDPETRYMSNNEPVCNFSIATDETWKDKDGNRQQRTEWHNIVVYRRLAEICQQYLKKGSLVFIDGRISSRKYTGKDGIERTAYDIIANDMKMLGSRSENTSNSGYSPFPEETASSAENSTPPEPPRRPVEDKPAEPMSDLEDDIPF
ncbi:MAG: single-stranded DNA-binding protein [Neisseriaceae bacterium]|nr:single-stranded DNA-binding protein [Neisseriaceae bacterium]